MFTEAIRVIGVTFDTGGDNVRLALAVKLGRVLPLSILDQQIGQQVGDLPKGIRIPETTKVQHRALLLTDESDREPSYRRFLWRPFR